MNHFELARNALTRDASYPLFVEAVIQHRKDWSPIIAYLREEGAPYKTVLLSCLCDMKVIATDSVAVGYLTSLVAKSDDLVIAKHASLLLSPFEARSAILAVSDEGRREDINEFWMLWMTKKQAERIRNTAEKFMDALEDAGMSDLSNTVSDMVEVALDGDIDDE